jgi:hypothetical protein
MAATTTRKRTTPARRERTLLIEQGVDYRAGGTEGSRRFKLTIPAGAKVTYGTLHAGQGKGDYSSAGAVLRIYEGTTQTCMFRNVLTFQDTGYPMEVEVVEYTSDDDVTTVDGKTVVARHNNEREARFEARSF